jgi:hypothetical protein
VSAEITPAFPAQWFYGLYALSPVNHPVCHRRPREACQLRLDLSARFLGRQDHTISPYASPPLVERHLYVHRIPARVRDDRDTPLDSGLEQNGNIKEDLKWVKRALGAS